MVLNGKMIYQDFMRTSKKITMKIVKRVTTYPYGTNAFKLCESEMLSKIRV